MGEQTPSTLGPRSARAGALGGLIGGAIGGALGGAVAAGLADLGALDGDNLLRGAAVGAAVFGAAGLPAGMAVGQLAAPSIRFAAARWALVATFWAGLAAAVDAAQGHRLAAACTFAAGTALIVALIALAPRLRSLVWKARWLLLGWLLLCLVGEGYSRLRPKSFAPLSPPPGEPVVQIHSVPLPGPLGYIARHHFFLSFDPTESQPQWHRWDLWQHADVGGTSWGHVHRDLLDLASGVGGYPPRPEREWRGDEARALLAALGRSSQYPRRDRYVALPGPNCNTYVAWVLREAGVPDDLDPRALGRDYLGPVGVGGTTTGTGVQAESTLVGFKVGLRDGAEVHFLTFTFGVGAWPPSVKTPFGRVGFPE